jgi:chromosomal replication initiation ATPase DnaA
MIADFNLLLEETAKTFKVTPEEILGPKRTRIVSLARHVVMTLWSDYHPFQDASDRCNRNCHSTAMWARQRVLNLADLNPMFSTMVARIAKRCQYGRTEPENDMEDEPIVEDKAYFSI